MNYKIFVCGELTQEGFPEKLGINVLARHAFVLYGYAQNYLLSGKAVLTEHPASRVSGNIIEISDDSVWLLDQWEELPLTDKERISIERGGIKTDIFLYICRTDRFICSDSSRLPDSIDDFILRQFRYRNQRSDLYLLVPCSIVDENRLLALADSCPGYHFASLLIKKINAANADEFKDVFVKNIKRVCLGSYYFTYTYIGTGTEQQTITQPCNITCSIHGETQLAVLNISMPAVSASMHQIMAYFCYQQFQISDGSGSMEFSSWMSACGIEPHGTARSIVFSSKPLEETELLNALASEAEPMGEIISDELIRASRNNIAQYNTAQVFVSENVLIEIFNVYRENVFDRLDYQCIELFFLELILLQNAAISRLCDRIQNRIELEKNNPRAKQGDLDDLVAESSQAIRFWDIDQFYYPTVRMSAKKIADLFGMQRQIDKYNTSIEILEKLVGMHEAKVEATESDVLNSLVLLLTIVQVFPSFLDIVKSFLQHSVTLNDIVAFLYSCGISAFILAIFAIIRNISLQKRLRKHKKRKGFPK